MGSRSREQEYILETLGYIRTVRQFFKIKQQWVSQRETELKTMNGIKNGSAANLADVLKGTLKGLTELQPFLDAVERLAVTSLAAFTDDGFLPEGENVEAIRSMIFNSRQFSSGLILFKRDAAAFFSARLENVDVLEFQLHRYTRVIEWLCENISTNSLRGFSLERRGDSIDSDRWSQLSKIRKDEPFRLMFLFQEEHAQKFTETLSGCRSRMFESLSGLEGNAVQLDRMKTGSSISTVAGSSVGIVGGGLSIAGLILAPFTAGLSLGLTVAGAGMGLTSAVNGVVTGITEVCVNSAQENYAKQNFQSLLGDTQKVLDILEQAATAKRPEPRLGKVHLAYEAEKNIRSARTVYSSFKTIKNGVVAWKALKGASETGRIPRVIGDLPDIGKLAKGTPLALSKTARITSAGINALFIGFDIYFLCTESISLAHGGKTQASMMIRSRSVLWRSEIQAWDKISKSLHEANKTFQEKMNILEPQ